MRRSRLLALLLLAVWGLAGPAASAPVPFAEEYRIKAAFLYKFTKFVEWPPQAYQGEPAHHVFCVYGTDPFGPLLDQTLAGKQVDGRATVAQRVRDPGALRRCQLVFVSASEDALLPEILAVLGDSPVLLIGESPDFARRGGTINFFLRQGQVRFEINPRAAQRARLKVSVQLLELADIIGPRAARMNDGK
jgi:YfiR/HmsC-like